MLDIHIRSLYMARSEHTNTDAHIHSDGARAKWKSDTGLGGGQDRITLRYPGRAVLVLGILHTCIHLAYRYSEHI